MLCPCGTELAYAQCCQPLIMATQPANSPEQLMRSRYSAYATKQAEYIYLTYAQASKAEQSITGIVQWAAQTKWLKLIIHYASNHQLNSTNHESAQVEFSAFYLHQGEIWHMRERSNFIIEEAVWRYLEGNLSDSTALNKPKRNDLCFCGSGTKFKHCCSKAF